MTVCEKCGGNKENCFCMLQCGKGCKSHLEKDRPTLTSTIRDDLPSPYNNITYNLDNIAQHYRCPDCKREYLVFFAGPLQGRKYFWNWGWVLEK